MKRFFAGIAMAVLLVGLLTACGGPRTWEENYDLGVRYLSEGKYEDAILAFQAAIQIDPKQADAYIGLADVYIAMEDYAQAAQAIQDGLAAAEDPEGVAALQAKLEEISALAPELELLGHTWAEATCTAPKTCTVCGETEGDPLPHTPTEANYQDPSVCTVCGETLSEPLMPDFVTYGIATDAQVGVHYTYTTNCSAAPEEKTVADAVILDYSIVESDDAHEAKEGYEWRIVTMEFTFTDDNAKSYGYRVRWPIEDYYNIRFHDDTTVTDEDGNATYKVNFHGQEMECKRVSETLFNGWEDNVGIMRVRIAFQAPIGYDGGVVGWCDATIEYPEDGPVPDSIDTMGALLPRHDGVCGEGGGGVVHS